MNCPVAEYPMAIPEKQPHELVVALGVISG